METSRTSQEYGYGQDIRLIAKWPDRCQSCRLIRLAAMTIENLPRKTAVLTNEAALAFATCR